MADLRQELRAEWPFARRFALTAGLVVAFDHLLRVVAERVLPADAHLDLSAQLAIHRVDHAIEGAAVAGSALMVGMCVLALLALIPLFAGFGRTGVRANVMLGVAAGGMLANLASLARTGFVLDFLALRVGSTGYFSFVPADAAIWLGTVAFCVVMAIGLFREPPRSMSLPTSAIPA